MTRISKALAQQYNERAKQGVSSNRLKKGVHLLVLNSITGEVIAEGSNAGLDRVHLSFADPNGTYEDIKESWIYGDPNKAWCGINAAKIAKLLQCFGAELEEAEDVQGVVRQIAKFKGKKLRVAIKEEQRIWKRTDGPWKVVHDPKVWYFGAANEELGFDEAKSITLLKPEDQAAWDDYVASRGNGATSTPAQAQPQQSAAPAKLAESVDFDSRPSAPVSGDNVKQQTSVTNLSFD